MKTNPLFKAPRLRSFSYKGCYAYSITLCTFNRKCILNQRENFENILSILRKEIKKHNFILWAHCFMPDHLHLLVQGESGSSDLKKFLRIFKQRTSFQFKQKDKNPLWQRSYWDHVLRKKEYLEQTALYILGNPVRAGLVKDWKKYPFSGSDVLGKEPT